MKCFSCEHDLDDTSEYHDLCVRRLFGVGWVPKIPFKSGDIYLQAQKLVGNMSISGAQEKLSISLNKNEKILEVTTRGGSHILKPSPGRFPYLAENENLCMNLASGFSIETPPHGLLPLENGPLVYIVRRFDRDYLKDRILKIHVEDFAQLLEREDKYNGSIEQIGKFIKENSEIPFIDTQKLFARVSFNFLIGNGDAHLKNFAMIRPPGRGYRLAPAYDIVNSRLVMPDEKEEMALAINGRKNNITIKDFEELARYLEVESKQYNKLMDSARLMNAGMREGVYRSFLPNDFKDGFIKIFEGRNKRLFASAV